MEFDISDSQEQCFEDRPQSKRRKASVAKSAILVWFQTGRKLIESIFVFCYLSSVAVNNFNSRWYIPAPFLRINANALYFTLNNVKKRVLKKKFKTAEFACISELEIISLSVS